MGGLPLRVKPPNYSNLCQKTNAVHEVVCQGKAPDAPVKAALFQDENEEIERREFYIRS